MSANDRQVGGAHYQKLSGCCPNCGQQLQHWDIVSMFNLGYLIGNATKYLFRYREKNGAQDLEKAKHYIDKQIEELKLNTATASMMEEAQAAALCTQCDHPLIEHSEHGCEHTIGPEHEVPKCENCGHMCTEMIFREPPLQCGCPGVCGDCTHAHAKFTACPICSCGREA